jgi:hypothetical protein
MMAYNKNYSGCLTTMFRAAVILAIMVFAAHKILVFLLGS